MLSTLKSKYETVSKNEFSLNGAIQAMAIELTNIAEKRQLISVSEFRPILDIIFVLFSLHVSSGLCKFAVQTSGSLMAVKGFWTENVITYIDKVESISTLLILKLKM